MGRVASVDAGAATNQYEILLRLASGGMAEIFVARALTFGDLERYVVLKRVLPERSRDPEFIRMFLDEARLAAQLHHPNVAQVYDIGRLASGYFFTMEYVHGHDIAQVWTRVTALRRQMPIGHVLTVIAGAAAGLHHAHDRRGSDQQPLGIVHRDVTPSNLMVSFEGAIKLVDFGIAKATRRATETRAGLIKGKLEYLSPEQCAADREVDRRTDVFALGIVMWELLTGQRRFKRETEFLTMNAIVNEDPPAPSTLRPEIPEDLDRIVQKALARDPDQRFSSAADLLEAIEDVAASHRTPISTAALGRYLRELFGDRPEPWIEAATQHSLPSTIVTATVDRSKPEGEPVAADSTEIESALAAIAVVTAPVIEPMSAPIPYTPPMIAPPRVQQAPHAPMPVAPQPRRFLWMGVSFFVTLAIGVAIYLAVHRDEPTHDVPITSTSTSTSTNMSAATSPDVATPQVDARIAQAGIASDAAQVAPDAPDAPDAQRARARDPEPRDAVDTHRAPEPPTRAHIAEAIRRGELAAAFASCGQLGASAPADLCVISACGTKHLAAASEYLRAAGESNRARLVSACQRVGVKLDRSDRSATPPRDPCEVDPMSCQR